MCIALLTTAHPEYALIFINNRDEYILRPTSRPHWWTKPVSPSLSRKAEQRAEDVEDQQILSSRDLYRAEQGSWLGITKTGQLAVLTNYREFDISKMNKPGGELRSRGAMVSAWLSQPSTEPAADFIAGMIAEGKHADVGGFSLLCGRLRRQRTDGNKLEPLGILSNRSQNTSETPWIGSERGQTWGLSNTWYGDTDEWRKLKDGKEVLHACATASASRDDSPLVLQQRLFAMLDRDTLPGSPAQPLEKHLPNLRESIFVPALGDEAAQAAMGRSPKSSGCSTPASDDRPPQEPDIGFSKGLYGTQRQTVILVDWDGNVTYTERALWDETGRAIPRGEGDMTFEFKIEGWADDGPNS